MTEPATTQSARAGGDGDGGEVGDRALGGCSFLLFVSGASTPSARAIQNVQEMCEQHLAGRHVLKVVDLHQDPELARAHRVLATPTLVKVSPAPELMLVGQFTDYPQTLARLGLELCPEPAGQQVPQARTAPSEQGAAVSPSVEDAR